MNVRGLLVAICRLLVRIYFSKIEITGLERVPEHGPVVMVLNHPNGLLDPIFVLTCCQRKVSFLAKEPLFRMPVVGLFVRTFECLPVYRKSDGADPAKNREMVQRSIALLQSGNALAVFPEGTSHSDPSLMPFRTGAARIALAASAPSLGAREVNVVPCGLYYDDKTTFRSKVLVNFGHPVRTPRVELDERFQPPPAATREFTAELERALAQVTLNAPSIEVLRLTQLAERLLSGAESDSAALERRPRLRRSIDEAREIRARMVAGYGRLAEVDPEALSALVRRIDTFEAFMAGEQLAIEQRVLFPNSVVVPYVLSALLVSVTLLPLALIGLLMNVLSYHFVAWLARRYAKAEADLVSSGKVVGGMLTYPAAWLICSIVVAIVTAPLWGLVTLIGSPIAAWAALRFLERAGHAYNQGHVVIKLLIRKQLRRRIVAERAAIRDAIFALEDRLAALDSAGQSQVLPH